MWSCGGLVKALRARIPMRFGLPLLYSTAGRAVLVIVLVGALVGGGWWFAQYDRSSAGATANPTVNTVPLPPVAMASAPVNLASPVQTTSEVQSWANRMADKLDVPARALVGYVKADVILHREQAGCHLSWLTLAGVGSVASDHGRAGGRELRPDGMESSPLNANPLPGAVGVDTSATHGFGPMQLSSSVWRAWQRRADGPGAPSMQNIDDAALATGRALCAGGRNLATGKDWWDSVRSLRDSDLFLERVLAAADLYGSLAQDGPTPPPAALRAVNFAISQLGLPYVWGGNGPDHGALGFDCSGLTTASYADAGVTLLRKADWQFHSVQPVHAGAPLRLGDLVFYGNPSGFIHHVGLYIGNNQMINAPDFGMAVQVGSVRYPGDDYAGAARPVN